MGRKERRKLQEKSSSNGSRKLSKSPHHFKQASKNKSQRRKKEQKALGPGGSEGGEGVFTYESTATIRAEPKPNRNFSR